MAELLSVNTVIFTILGYQMSLLEFAGTILNLWSVWLVVRNNILTWPVGIVGVVLFAFLFYQIQLYSDLIEQFYYLTTGFYGWWLWSRRNSPAQPGGSNGLQITSNRLSSNLLYLLVIALATFALTSFMARVHLLLPTLVPEPASFPFLDAFTTVMSFAAQILMANKKLECWYLWILVDVIGIGLYHAKGTIFLSLLYSIFLVLAVKGYFSWRKLFLSTAAVDRSPQP